MTIKQNIQKIAFFSPSYLPNIGGVEKHVFNLMTILNEDNYYCYLFTQSKNNDKVGEIKENSKLTIYRNKNYFYGMNLISMNYFLIKNLKLLLSFDIIHFHDSNTFWRWGIFIYPVLRIFNKKVYITFHGWEGHIPPKKSIIFLRRISLFLTNGSIAVGHYIEKWYGTKCDTISYGGVHIPKNNNLVATKNFVFIGRLSRDTGVLAYLEAWCHFSISYPEFNLIVCGDGELRKDVEEFIIQNKLCNVTLVGMISNPEIYLCDAVAVLTSGFLGILESFSFKKPVIAYYDNALKEDYLKLIPNGEDMFWISNNSTNIVNCMIEILLNKNSKVDLAYHFATKNTWDTVKNQYLRLWNC